VKGIVPDVLKNILVALPALWAAIMEEFNVCTWIISRCYEERWNQNTGRENLEGP